MHLFVIYNVNTLYLHYKFTQYKHIVNLQRKNT